MTPLPPRPTTPAATADERALTLLLKAIDTLDAAERTDVLMFLLKRGLSAAAEPAPFFSVGTSVQALGAIGTIVRPNVKPEPGAQQMVPVRFSADAHQRLRTWCGENGFPMAAVVRGLVDQFLEAQPATSGS